MRLDYNLSFSQLFKILRYIFALRLIGVNIETRREYPETKLIGDKHETCGLC